VTTAFLTEQAIQDAAEQPRATLTSAPAKLHQLGADYAATCQQISSNVLLAPDERDQQLAAAANAVQGRRDALADAAEQARVELHAIVDQVQADVAAAPLPASTDDAAIAQAWDRAWISLTRQDMAGRSAGFTNDKEIVDQLASWGDPAMLSALLLGIPRWASAEHAGKPEATAEALASELLAVADKRMRHIVFGDAIGQAQVIEDELLNQVQAVEQALREMDAALAQARLAQMRA
jgi:hypothetical protein